MQKINKGTFWLMGVNRKCVGIQLWTSGAQVKFTVSKGPAKRNVPTWCEHSLMDFLKNQLDL